MRLRQIAVPVRDVDDSVRFYRDVVGLEFLFAAGPDLAFLAIEDVRLMLSRATDEHPAGSASILYLSVDDAAAAHSDMVDRGAVDERGAELTARMPDHELWIAFVRDPDGNLIGLMEERRSS